jgi:hypothetical protein
MLLASSFSTAMAPPQHDPYGTSELAEKVLRRIEIAKVGASHVDICTLFTLEAHDSC